MQTVYADLNEIVFEDRERSYGAYVMRKWGAWSLSVAMLIALIVYVIIFVIPWFISVLTWEKPVQIKEEPEEQIIEMVVEDLPPPPDEPPPIEEKIPPPIKTQEFKIPEPTPEEELEEEETIVEQDSLIETPDLETVDTVSLAEFDWDKVKDDSKTAITTVADDPEPDPNAFVMVEQEPAPVNLDEIKKLIGYPPMAKEAEIQGTVHIRILVDKTGKYVKHIVQKDPHPLLTKAVEDKIKNLSFTPGISGGKPVKVWISIPFKFTLTK